MKRLLEFVALFCQYSKHHSPWYAWRVAKQITYQGFPF
jgi:hypothetical protein